MCVSRHTWELRRMWMVLESSKKCRLLRSSFIKKTFSIFTLAVVIKLRFRANFLKIGNIRVASLNLAVLPHTWWSPWPYGDLARDLGRPAKLVHSGHYGYRWKYLDMKNTVVLNDLQSIYIAKRYCRCYIVLPLAGVDTISTMEIRELFDSRKSMFWGYRILLCLEMLLNDMLLASANDDLVI